MKFWWLGFATVMRQRVGAIQEIAREMAKELNEYHADGWPDAG